MRKLRSFPPIGAPYVIFEGINYLLNQLVLKNYGLVLSLKCVDGATPRRKLRSFPLGKFLYW